MEPDRITGVRRLLGDMTNTIDNKQMDKRIAFTDLTNTTHGAQDSNGHQERNNLHTKSTGNTSGKVNTENELDDGWLHRNDAYIPGLHSTQSSVDLQKEQNTERKRAMARSRMAARRAAMTAEQKEEANKKRRDGLTADQKEEANKRKRDSRKRKKEELSNKENQDSGCVIPTSDIETRSCTPNHRIDEEDLCSIGNMETTDIQSDKTIYSDRIPVSDIIDMPCTPINIALYEHLCGKDMTPTGNDDVNYSENMDVEDIDMSSERHPGNVINITRKRAHAYSGGVVPKFRLFENISLCDVGLSWSIAVRVDVKFEVQNVDQMQRFIFMDTTGARILAEVRGVEFSTFKLQLSEGSCYILHDVRFQTLSNDKFRNIGCHFQCRLDHLTRVMHYGLPNCFPSYPSRLMSFEDVQHGHYTPFVDVLGIIVHWGKIEHIGFYPNRHLYREIVIMDASCKLLVVGIWSKLLARHILSLPGAASNNDILCATMLKNNRIHKCCETSDYTKFCFNPPHNKTKELQGLRHVLVTKSMDTLFVNRFLEGRWAYLATVL